MVGARCEVPGRRTAYHLHSSPHRGGGRWGPSPQRRSPTSQLLPSTTHPRAASASHPIAVVCADVRSLLNVGAIFRLSDATRVERLYLCGITGYPRVTPDSRPPWVAERADRVIAKTALQTVEAVPWEYRPDPLALLEELKGRGYQIVALERTPTSVAYVEAAYAFPVALVVGHEREGVANRLLDVADLIVAIPMYGRGTSLNVATALAVALYDLVRRWRLAAAAR